MQSKATTVEQYLAALPPDRRAALETVRAVIRKNLDKHIEEGMQYGMIGYYVPHSVFPAGYHCDPKQPLPFAGLASQKGYMSCYLMCLYMDGTLLKRFTADWAKTGKKLDMGKACIRFKRADDLALDVIGALFKSVTSKQYIDRYVANLGPRAASAASARKAATPQRTLKPTPQPTSKPNSKTSRAVAGHSTAKPVTKVATKSTTKSTAKSTTQSTAQSAKTSVGRAARTSAARPR